MLQKEIDTFQQIRSNLNLKTLKTSDCTIKCIFKYYQKAFLFAYEKRKVFRTKISIS